MFGITRGQDSFSGKFFKREGGKDSYRIESKFTSMATKDFDLLIEDVKGEDLNPQFTLEKTWKAQIVWVKV